MKGAIGNALILNMVITFISIFFILLIGSVSYSKAYKVNNYLINTLSFYAEKNNSNLSKKSLNTEGNWWNLEVNSYLSKAGYIISNRDNTCPEDKYGYEIIRNTKTGSYEYCIYKKKHPVIDYRIDQSYSYKVISYMKFDFPFLGEFIKLPIVSESKVIVDYN